jgi:hypothetical protein
VWTRGFLWGFETFRVVALDIVLKVKVPTLTVHELLMDPEAIEEVLKISTEELLDALGLDVFHGADDRVVEENNEIEGPSEEIPRSPPAPHKCFELVNGQPDWWVLLESPFSF